MFVCMLPGRKGTTRGLLLAREGNRIVLPAGASTCRSIIREQIQTLVHLANLHQNGIAHSGRHGGHRIGKPRSRVVREEIHFTVHLEADAIKCLLKSVSNSLGEHPVLLSTVIVQAFHSVLIEPKYLVSA